YELSHRLPELLLMRVDKMTMAHSLEARVPFLDSRLVEFTMTIPPDKKMPPNATTKYLLKKAVEPILPHDIIYRKKQGFDAPIKEWLKNEWYDYIVMTFKQSSLTQQNILNLNFILKLVEQHRNSHYNHARQIFNLLNLVLWHKRFFS
ncbi:MAG TPA: asparagine synthase C-terminal domain-containing protein, partial [Candidatus Kapabacteria bacterium]|nr:asparagine synthase C-terminal domain-containing protein [Candidatus Kapabacteria bacterium]